MQMRVSLPRTSPYMVLVSQSNQNLLLSFGQRQGFVGNIYMVMSSQGS